MNNFVFISSIIICGIFLFSSCDKEKPISGKIIELRSDTYRDRYIYDGDKIVAVETYLFRNEKWKHIGTYNYKYESDKVIRQDVSITPQMTVNHTINFNNGKIEKIHHDEYDITYFYTYQDEYLSKVINIYGDNPSKWDETHLTYENGNITRIQVYRMPTTVIPAGIQYEYDSTSALNNTNIDLFSLFSIYESYYLTNYINNNVKRSKYLPSKVDGIPVSYEIRDGYVTKISRMVDYNMSILEVIYD